MNNLKTNCFHNVVWNSGGFLMQTYKNRIATGKNAFYIISFGWFCSATFLVVENKVLVRFKFNERHFILHGIIWNWARTQFAYLFWTWHLSEHSFPIFVDHKIVPLLAKGLIIKLLVRYYIRNSEVITIAYFVCVNWYIYYMKD